MMPASRLADQRGMSIVEVMVAALVLAIGVLATMNVVLGSRDLTTTSEKLEAASHVAEKELEALQSLRWTAQAHTGTPASGPAPHTVTTSNTYQWQVGSTEPLAIDVAQGAVPVSATSWSDGRLSGSVWRFVSWVNDASTPTVTQDYKRLTVVVTVNGRPALDNPVVLSTYSAQKEGV
jgi:prepilin-type N-terminal cleavage/methylation domain-containing protein